MARPTGDADESEDGGRRVDAVRRPRPVPWRKSSGAGCHRWPDRSAVLGDAHLQVVLAIAQARERQQRACLEPCPGIGVIHPELINRSTAPGIAAREKAKRETVLGIR